MGTEKLMLDPDHNNQLCYQILLTFFLLISLPLSLLSASLLSPIWSACITYITASRASICTRSWCCDSGQVHSWSTGQLDCTVQNCSTENGGRNGWRNGWRSITLIHCWSFVSLILFSRVFHSFDFAVFFYEICFYGHPNTCVIVDTVIVLSISISPPGISKFSLLSHLAY